MTRWYDYLAAILFAEIMLICFFTIPAIGAIIAYGMYELWVQWYCQFRLEQESQ